MALQGQSAYQRLESTDDSTRVTGLMFSPYRQSEWVKFKAFGFVIPFLMNVISVSATNEVSLVIQLIG